MEFQKGWHPNYLLPSLNKLAFLRKINRSTQIKIVNAKGNWKHERRLENFLEVNNDVAWEQWTQLVNSTLNNNWIIIIAFVFSWLTLLFYYFSPGNYSGRRFTRWTLYSNPFHPPVRHLPLPSKHLQISVANFNRATLFLILVVSSFLVPILVASTSSLYTHYYSY